MQEIQCLEFSAPGFPPFFLKFQGTQLRICFPWPVGADNQKGDYDWDDLNCS